jgi:parallel beta-helix repeat protein
MSTNPAASHHHTPAMFYVSPQGNDAWSGAHPEPNVGRTDGPFATIARARDAIRQLKRSQGGLTQPVRVSIREGTYFLPEPLVLTAEDSGTKECPVTYAAHEGERPVISGGAPITGWRREQVNGHSAWAAHLPQVQRGEWSFTQLFVNGERRPRPRLPKEGFYRLAGLVGAGPDTPWNEGQDKALFADEDIKPWKNLRDVEVVTLSLWVESHLPVAAVDEKERIVSFTRRSVFRLTEDFAGAGSRYYVSNVFEALDTPGQWYLDRGAGTLYYLPKRGEEPERIAAIAPRLAQVVRFEGDAGKNQWVEHVRLQGLTFAHTEWRLPADVSGASQAAVNVPGAVLWQGARHCAIRDCTIAHVGNYAMELAAGCEHNVVSGCAMFDLGAGGIKVGHGTAHTLVSDNDIGDGGHIFHSAVGVWVGNSGHNQVVHNHIHDLDYTGVSVGWTWGYGASDAVDNRVEFNHIHHVGRGILSDLGGIYTLGISPGTVLAHNLIHDSWSATYGGWGIYLDEGSTGIVVENNVVYRTKTGGFHQHYGRENMIRNNIFALGKEMQITRSREEEHRSFSFERNIVYWTEGELLSGTWKNGNFFFDYNLYCHADESGESPPTEEGQARRPAYQEGCMPFTFAGASLDEWRARGMDVHSLIADPQFTDPAHDDFTLAADSPAFSRGFRAIDISRVGPRGPEQRKR